ncbi:MAG: cache domain-containing protein [Desulfobulbaceae bacterium]|nr:cache domain-containing protein [Desulfobulbaceae bacterium]
MSLRWKLLIPFLFLALIGAISLFIVSYRFENSLIHVNEEKQLRNQYRIFLNTIGFKKNMAMSLASLTAKNPEVARTFAARDRQQLLTLLQPGYRILNEFYGVEQFHFHVPPATSFLRLHAPEQYGDEMVSFRPTIVQALKTDKGVSGIEAGVFGMSIRGVAPVFYEAKLIGTVEVGLSMAESFLQEFKDNYGSELVVYVADESEGKKSKVFAATRSAAFLPPDQFERSYLQGEVVLQKTRLDNLSTAIITGPVTDFTGRIIAVVEISVDRSLTLALLKKYASIAVTIGLVGFGVSVVFIYCIAVLYTRRIERVVESAEQIAGGRRDTGIALKSRDELGMMATAINRMLLSLEQSKERLRNYAENLEVMVEERTRSLLETEQTYRTLVEHVPLIVYMISPEGTLVLLNCAVEKMIGLPAEMLNGSHDIWTSHIHADDRVQVAVQREKCLRSGKDFTAEYRMLHRDGHTVYCQDHAVAIVDAEGVFVGMDGIVIDVTATRELQGKVLQAEELKTLGQISSCLAHELRNPLTSIGGLTRLLRKSFEEEDPRSQKSELIVEQVEKLEKILKMMLAYIGPQTINLVPNDLNMVVSGVIEKLETGFSDWDFSVKKSLDDSLKPIRIDRDLFSKVLMNLIENALHRMGQKGEIRVGTRKKGDHTRLTLAYRVPHISNADIESFFFPFAVAYPFAGGGTDKDIMDLPMCKIIIHKHGGLIDVAKEDEDFIKIAIDLPGG